jgi:hypothetical protein
MPSPDLGGARLARQLDLVCSALAVTATAGVWAGAWLSRAGTGMTGDEIVLVTKLSCMILLCAALGGIWLMQEAAGWPRLAASLMLDAIGRRLSFHAGSRAVHLAPEETPARGIAGLIEAVAARFRRLNGRSAYPGEPSDMYVDSLREGRIQAQQIVRALYSDADLLCDVSGEIEAAGGRLIEGVRVVSAACDGTEAAIANVADQVVALTGAVGATTAEVRRASAMAVGMSERAFSSHRYVAGLDDTAAAMVMRTEQIEQLLQRIGALGQSASIEAARSGEAGQALAPIAASLQEVACASIAAIAAMQKEVAGMASEALAATRQTQELCEQVKVHHEIGLNLAQAVSQQGEAIAGILQTLDTARSGFVTLRAGVEAVSRQGSGRLAKAGALRDAASRLPSQADAVAAILRDIPDLVPPAAFDF